MLLYKKNIQKSSDSISSSPIIAKATEINEDGKEISEEKLLKIDIPLSDDVKTLNKSIKRGEPNMDEIDVRRVINESLEEKELIKNIGEINKKIDKLVEENSTNRDIISRLSERLANVQKNTDVLEKKTSTTCEGVECLKKEIEEIRKISNDIYENSAKPVGICSGEKGCNAEIPYGSSYCPNCGKSVKSWPGMPEWKHYKERTK